MRKRICPAFWPGTCTTGCKYPAANGTQGTCKLLVSRCLLPSPVTFILKFLLGLSGPGYLFAPRPLQSWVHSPSPFFFHPPFLSSPLQLWRGARGATTKKHNTATFKKNVTRVVTPLFDPLHSWFDDPWAFFHMFDDPLCSTR